MAAIPKIYGALQRKGMAAIPKINGALQRKGMAAIPKIYESSSYRVVTYSIAL